MVFKLSFKHVNTQNIPFKTPNKQEYVDLWRLNLVLSTLTIKKYLVLNVK